jgi:TatA/E family protein of Tat protein translocase
VGLENPLHLVFIGVVALLVLGPRRLPEVARALGRGVREFREAMGQGASRPRDPPTAAVPGDGRTQGTDVAADAPNGERAAGDRSGWGDD